MHFAQDTIETTAHELRTSGRASVLLDGRVLVLASTPFLGLAPPDTPRLMVALEGGGCMLFDGQRPLSDMRLVQHGFNLRVAGRVAGLINGMVAVWWTQRRAEAPNDDRAKALLENEHGD